MKRFIIYTSIILVVAVLLFLKWKKTPSTAPADAKAGKQGPVAVTGYIIKSQPMDNKLQVTGTVTANQEVNLQSEISGRVLKIYFREGNPVKKGALLLKLQDDDMQAQLQKLKLQDTLARKMEQRQKQLLAISGVSQQEYDIALNQVRTIEAEIALLRTNISKTEIYAPFSGNIGLKSISEGAYLTPSVVIASLQEIDPVKIDFSIPEKYMNLVKVGGNINFTLQGGQGKLTATIQAIEPKVDQATRTIQIRALCSNPNRNIFPGAFADIELPLETIPNAMMVPTQSVLSELKGHKVYVAKGGKAVSMKVETGVRNDSTLQIVSGVSPGDTLITTGLMQLKPGAALKFVKVTQ